MRKQVDVVIVGGAVTGSILALALSSATHHKMQIAIVEKNIPNYEKQGGFDARAIALAQGSLQKLANIRPLATTSSGHLKEIICQLATPIQQIYVSDQHHFGKTVLSADELNIPQLGAVVELATLGKTLASLISQQPNITLFCPDQVVKIERSQQKCSLTLASKICLDCSLMIAADGIHSQLAEQCGIATLTEKSYAQSAITANVRVSEAHNSRAFERFTAEGPFALLPLQENVMSLVWCVKDPNEIIALSDEQFLSALQRQFGWKLGRFLQASKRFVYPLSLQKAESHIHHRLAIVGNAAQLLHPVAGQGFNLGMRDIYQLTQLVSNVFNQQQDIGNYALLSQFEQQRQADQQRIITATSGLISLFSCDLLPLQIGRNLGLAMLNQNRFLRNQTAHQALGW
ncbi:2-octaprenyl-6-methoxyphenyl hydroxylase [Vespertiliibacter pulmonis]|uniref:2-octaprenyl-6-methoxyphenol hydroxylase n=1 Tax=Vespertiliibacter pulmonis TaxID=1443036 RepID=A0A3N4W1I8_9PAST|nr:2-octaprenyl-6-methoxyphenyl hydroxylase [Vespertiliibacter pulmonis]QLB20231.1 2-octaprenyl-6-methoxyphenyl hydroxylase [Vespertiliibacter pulmonis]RPE86209.1 2-octaprenyl-6-methoxyphenol hydroxylase [Vespertiliibacter pulmonis]